MWRWIARLAALVETAVSDTLAYYAFPEGHWRRIRTNDPLERIMREICWRTRVVGAFPDGNSAINLAAQDNLCCRFAALAADADDDSVAEWFAVVGEGAVRLNSDPVSETGFARCTVCEVQVQPELVHDLGGRSWMSSIFHGRNCLLIKRHGIRLFAQRKANPQTGS